MVAKKVAAKVGVKAASTVLGLMGTNKDSVRPSCGAYALAQVCKKLGVSATPEEIAADSDDGVNSASMAGMIKAATKRGLTAQPAQWTIQDLKQKGAAVSGRMLM